MRILVLPDVHYPATRLDVLELALSGDYDEVVLLGDAVDERERLADLMGLVGRSAGRVTLVRGDNEERMGIGGLESYEPRRGLVLVHGHIANLGSEGFTKLLARMGRRVSRGLVLGFYAARLSRRDALVVAGHAHALGYSRRFRVAFAGSLSLPSPSRPFNEVGYAVIDGDEVILFSGNGRQALAISIPRPSL